MQALLFSRQNSAGVGMGEIRGLTGTTPLFLGCGVHRELYCPWDQILSTTTRDDQRMQLYSSTQRDHDRNQPYSFTHRDHERETSFNTSLKTKKRQKCGSLPHEISDLSYHLQDEQFMDSVIDRLTDLLEDVKLHTPHDETLPLSYTPPSKKARHLKPLSMVAKKTSILWKGWPSCWNQWDQQWVSSSQICHLPVTHP